MPARREAAERPSVVALIPARSGSKRLPNKNIRLLGGHPLLAYSVAAARQSGIFDAVIVSTDSQEYASVGRHYRAEVPFLRPAEIAGDTSPDIEWVDYTMRRLQTEGREFDFFSILRPTSPFRTGMTIRRAWGEFHPDSEADSIRAVERCRQHPGKMWIIEGSRMRPLLPRETGGVPWHSSQYQSLPEVHIQNASLEIARSRVVFEDGTIAGKVVMPFLTEGTEGLDVNDPIDWRLAEDLLARGEAQLPTVEESAFLPPSSGA